MKSASSPKDAAISFSVFRAAGDASITSATASVANSWAADSVAASPAIRAAVSVASAAAVVGSASRVSMRPLSAVSADALVVASLETAVAVVGSASSAVIRVLNAASAAPQSLSLPSTSACTAAIAELVLALR